MLISQQRNSILPAIAVVIAAFLAVAVGQARADGQDGNGGNFALFGSARTVVGGAGQATLR